jgi:hypothetical protein
MDAEEVGDLLDRVPFANALDGQAPSALQFIGRARSSHTRQRIELKARVALLF